MIASDERKRRQAAALRDNLLKRKAQSRERKAAVAAEAPAPFPAPPAADATGAEPVLAPDRPPR